MSQQDNVNFNCSALCPVCNSDLYLMENACVCKNATCDWQCKDCKNEDEN